MGISNNTKSELANIYLNSLNMESINLKALIIDSGLSTQAIKEMLNELVDRCAENPNKPSIRKDEYSEFQIKSVLVNKYGLTYSIAKRLIEMYNIEFPSQLKYLSDTELREVTGIGEFTLKKIRESFPYEESEVIRKENTSIAVLHLPSKIEEVLRTYDVLNIKQLELFLSSGIEDIGYPKSNIIYKSYELYQEDETDIDAYRKEYLSIFLQSYIRNLNNIIRHSDSKLNTYWINDSLYNFITYIYELMGHDEEILTKLTDNFEMLKSTRKTLLDSLYANSSMSNIELIEHYKSVKDTIGSIYKVLYII